MEFMTAMSMLSAQTQLEATHALAVMATLEMEKSAHQVSIIALFKNQKLRMILHCDHAFQFQQNPLPSSPPVPPVQKKDVQRRASTEIMQVAKPSRGIAIVMV